MEAASVIRSPLSIWSPQLHKLGSTSTSTPSISLSFSSKFHFSKTTSSLYNAELGGGRFRIGKSLVVRASKSSNPSDSPSPIAPLELESPVGQFLSQILANHPHLVPAAVDQQLEQLLTECEAEKQKQDSSASGTDLVLYRRIAEVKANERRKALGEILYTLVVQKFMDANISLTPCISSLPDDPIERLEEVHSHEAYEMIQNHLALTLGGNQPGYSSSVIEISKLRVGQVYAASVMFGYFLKRIDERFQLEKTMKILPEQMNERGNEIMMDRDDDVGPMANYSHDPEVSSWGGSGGGGGGVGDAIKPSRLRSYVMALDGDTLARYSAIRSKEAVSIIEKHTEALFGKPAQDSSRDELIKIGFDGLRRLVLEAVTFGSFLWDVESYVDSRYHLLLN